LIKCRVPVPKRQAEARKRKKGGKKRGDFLVPTCSHCIPPTAGKRLGGSLFDGCRPKGIKKNARKEGEGRKGEREGSLLGG